MNVTPRAVQRRGNRYQVPHCVTQDRIGREIHRRMVERPRLFGPSWARVPHRQDLKRERRWVIGRDPVHLGASSLAVGPNGHSVPLTVLSATNGNMTEASQRRLRVLLVDDSALFRQGLAALLTAADLDVVGELSDARDIVPVIRRVRADMVVLDARMPPTHRDEGIRAALMIRQELPAVGVLVLSTYAEGAWARSLFAGGSAGLGYMLKDRVNDTAALIQGIWRISEGGSAVDPEVVERLLELTNRRSLLDNLTDREREVLALMAEGRSNAGIGKSLFLSPRTVEAYIASIFTKLPLNADDSTTNRRVLAVLRFLQDQQMR